MWKKRYAKCQTWFYRYIVIIHFGLPFVYFPLLKVANYLKHHLTKSTLEDHL